MNRSFIFTTAVLTLVGIGGAVFALDAGSSPERATAATSVVTSASGSVVPARSPRPAPLPPPASEKSPEQERLEQRRWLYEMVDSLLVNGEIDRARKYLDEGLARYGEDSAGEWRDLDVGYRLLADCLEQPKSARHRVRARAFAGVTEARGLVPKLQAACN